MRIAFDARYLRSEYSGIGVYTEGLLQSLGRLDHSNEYFVFVHSSFRGDLGLPDNFELIEEPAPPVSVRTLASLHREAERIGADVYFSSFPLAPILWRRKLAVTVHDLQPLTDPDFTSLRPPLKRLGYDWFYRIFYPWCIRKADCLVVNSYTTRETIRQFLPDAAGKALVVHPGVPEEVRQVPTDEQIEQVRQRFDIPERFLFYLGSTRPNKNLPMMLDAFEEFVRRHPEHDDLKWVMVLKPDRFFDPLFARIRDRGMLRRVHIHEQITELEKRVFYRLATLVYFVTKHEGFGLPVLEAQAQGVPALISTHGALPEVAGDGALQCNPDDRDSIVAGLEEFFSTPELRTRLVEAGYRNLNRFSWERSGREVLDMFNHVLA